MSEVVRDRNLSEYICDKNGCWRQPKYRVEYGEGYMQARCVRHSPSSADDRVSEIPVKEEDDDWNQPESWERVSMDEIPDFDEEEYEYPDLEELTEVPVEGDDE